MAKVAYKGIADVRELDAADLKKVGVEGFKKTSFPRNKPVEVDDNVAAALTDEKNALFGKFIRVEEPAEAPAEGQDPANSNSPDASSTRKR